MIYLYINKNTIKLLVLSKTLFGQYRQAQFCKTHEANLLEDGQVKSIDLLASAIKEALTLAGSLATADSSICLILPQEAFEFARFDIPADTSENAIAAFIADKARVEMKIEIDDFIYGYVSSKTNTNNKILLFAQEDKKYEQFSQVFQLIGLKIALLLPETLCYFELFNKTLRAIKKEIILYVHFQDKNSFGYLFDSLGLLDPKKINFSADIESSLKTKIEKWQKEETAINRIVLSGGESEKFRQDIFTKKTGVWTNPLKKIILNYYQDYLKLIILKPQEVFPFLDFDVCLGAFFFVSQNQSFTMKKSKTTNVKSIVPRLNLPIRITRRDTAIFIGSFIITFLTISSYPKIIALVSTEKKIAPVTSSPTIPISPSATPTPTPTFDKKTLKIKVLNGSGIKGAASDIKELLQVKGYEEVLIGNAQRFDVLTSSVQMKQTARPAFSILIDDLKDRISLNNNALSTLDDEQSADIILIIGQDFQ